MRLFSRWRAIEQGDDADVEREMVDLSVHATGPDGSVEAEDVTQASPADIVQPATVQTTVGRPRRCSPVRTVCHLSVCAIVVLCSVGVAMAVFVPWFMLEIEPDYALEARMVRTSCLVLAHETLATKPTDGNTVLLYLPGLHVSFDLHGTNATAVALPRLKEAACWMSGEVERDYFDKRPVGRMTTCYYDGERPTERVVTADGIDDIGKDLPASLILSGWVFVASLAVFGFAACCLLWALGDPDFQ